MGSTFVRSLLVAVCVFFLTIACFSAVQNAVLYGTVYDVSGNPLGGITVLLENPSIGLARVTITSPDGSYTISEVPPAEGYRITALRAGAKIDMRDGIVVNVGDERVIAPALHEQQPAGSPAAKEIVAKPVEKTVSNELVSAAMSSVITAEQLRSLPLYNRNFLALGLLAANTHDVEAGSALAGATFSIAGARPTSNQFLLDGSDNVASSSNQAIPFQVNDAIQEFRVITSLAGAEYGRNLGGVVNVVTRRGSNALHGSLFGYFADDALNANQPLSVYNGSGFDQAARYAGSLSSPNGKTYSPSTYNDYVAGAQTLGFCTDSLSAAAAPGLHRCASTGGYGKNTFFDPANILAANDSHAQPFSSQQFGANAGGALVKDKVFFFGSYEGTRIDNPNQVFERVPSTFDKTYNPLLALKFPGATPFDFTTSNADYQIATKVLSLYPASNVVAVPGVLEFFRGQAGNYTHVHNIIGRTDVVQNAKSNFAFRYSVQTLNQLHDATLPSTSQYPGNGALRDALNQNFSGTWTRGIGDHKTNELRAGYSRFRVDESPQDRAFGGSKIGIPGNQLMTFQISGIDPQYSGTSNVNYGAIGGWADSFWLPQVFGFTIPSMFPTLDGLFPMARIGAPLNAPSSRADTNVSIVDNFSWAIGRHSIRFGSELRVLRNRFFNGAFSRGFVTSGNIGEFTSDAETCTSCGDGFFAPSFDYALRQTTPFEGQFHSFASGSYLQDTWRINPRVTMTAGLRYEYFSPPSEQYLQAWNFDPAANGLVQQGGNKVVDPAGAACAARRTFASVYPDQAPTTPWTCQPTGSGAAFRSDLNNFAPRVGFAVDLFGTGKTVLRFGTGFYYDQLPVSYAAQLLYNRPVPVSTGNPQAIYGQNFLSNYSDSRLCIQCGFGLSTLDPARIAQLKTGNYQAASSPMSISAIDYAHSNSPYSRQVNASLQQQLNNKLAVEVGYVGTFGSTLPVVANTGFNNEWFCTTTAKCDFLGPVFTMTNQGESNYHSLVVRVRAAQWHGLRINATYNYAKSLDNASNSVFPLVPATMQTQLLGFQYFGLANPFLECADCTIAGRTPAGNAITGSDSLVSGLTTTGAGGVLVSRYNIPQDPVNFLHNDYGPSDFDNRQRLVADFTWEMPSTKTLPILLNHWTISGILTAHSGEPFSIFSGPIFGELTQRANVTGKVHTTGLPDGYIDLGNIQLASDKCGGLFQGDTLPGPGSACLGNSARNAFTGPAFGRLDLAFQKAFQFGEARSLVFRSEFYNILDRANFYNPISALSTDGSTINPDFGRIKSAASARQIQLAARFTF